MTPAEFYDQLGRPPLRPIQRLALEEARMRQDEQLFGFRATLDGRRIPPELVRYKAGVYFVQLPPEHGHAVLIDPLGAPRREPMFRGTFANSAVWSEVSAYFAGCPL